MSDLPIPEEQPFVMGIIGRRGSGKGFLCLDLLKYFYKGSFDFIVWISPTFHLQEMTLNIPDSTGIVVFSEWKSEIITSLFHYMNERNKGDRQGRPEKESCLLVLDDVGLLGKKGQLSEQLDMIAFTSRHYGISLIEMAQRISLLSTGVRSQLDALLLFKEQNPQERVNLFRSFGFWDKKTYFRTIDQYTEEKYSFVGIRNQAGRYYLFDLNGEITPRTLVAAHRDTTGSSHPRESSVQGIRDRQGFEEDLRRLQSSSSNNKRPKTSAFP
jgi:hypothetical protein